MPEGKPAAILVYTSQIGCAHPMPFSVHMLQLDIAFAIADFIGVVHLIRPIGLVAFVALISSLK